MKQYNFDEVIDRNNTSAYKLVLMEKFFGTTQGIPLWVADMDFKTPDFITDAIIQRSQNGILGYTLPSNTYTNSIADWLIYKHQWSIKESSIGFAPGVVTGLALAIQAFTQVGDKIMVQTPVYPPFLSLPHEHQRQLIINPLIFENNQFDIDFRDFEKKLSEGVKLFILCHPHNPGGRVWTKKELTRMAELCIKHHVLIISDEIHADLMLWDKPHFPLASLSPSISQNVVTLMAPSKTFNMPGLASAFFITENKVLYNSLQEMTANFHLNHGNVFGCMATEIAFNQGKDWLKQVIQYIEDNIRYVREFFIKYIPSIKVIVPDASFLVWLDCRALGMNAKELKNFMVHKAGVVMNDGATFGQGGEGFQRLNVACSRLILEKALQNIMLAIKNR